jgi:hypothetical protein
MHSNADGYALHLGGLPANVLEQVYIHSQYLLGKSAIRCHTADTTSADLNFDYAKQACFVSAPGSQALDLDGQSR